MAEAAGFAARVSGSRDRVREHARGAESRRSRRCFPAGPSCSAAAAARTSGRSKGSRRAAGGSASCGSTPTAISTRRRRSPSGNEWGMPLRMLIDGGAVAPADVALVGARNLDPPEERYIDEVGLALGHEGVERCSRARRGLRRDRCRRVWIRARASRRSCPSRPGSPWPTRKRSCAASPPRSPCRRRFHRPRRRPAERRASRASLCCALGGC